MADQRIIVALDVSTTSELKDLVAQIPNKHCRVKIGKELFTSVGPLAVDICHAAGLDVFLDLKFHDIPNTCAKAVLAAARLGVWMTNVHCAGGADMMRAAREILDGQAHRPLLIGVTVLTSMSQQDLLETGVERDLEFRWTIWLAWLSNRAWMVSSVQLKKPNDYVNLSVIDSVW